VVVFNHVHVDPGAVGNEKSNEQLHDRFSPQPASFVLSSKTTNSRNPESPMITWVICGAGIVAVEYLRMLNGWYVTLKYSDALTPVGTNVSANVPVRLAFFTSKTNVEGKLLDADVHVRKGGEIVY
jgi:hypothetical protein